MKIIRTTLAIILLATASVLAGTTPTWPQFRGPNGSGIGEDAHPPIHFGPDTSLWDERIFLTAFDRERKKLETICLDRQTGKVVWRRDAPAEKIERVHTISNPAASTPATDGRTVYVYFGSYGLIAYDFAGGLRWQKALPIAITRFGHGSGTSPILAGDRLILDVHLDQESYVLAVRCHDGETLWKSPKPLFNDGWSTPVVWREGKTGRASIKILKRRHNESSIEITIRQGLNRQVRRMLAKIGLPVKSLSRTRVGKLTVRGLGVGKFRTLTRAEVAYLKKATSG